MSEAKISTVLGYGMEKALQYLFGARRFQAWKSPVPRLLLGRVGYGLGNGTGDTINNLGYERPTVMRRQVHGSVGLYKKHECFLGGRSGLYYRRLMQPYSDIVSSDHTKIIRNK